MHHRSIRLAAGLMAFALLAGCSQVDDVLHRDTAASDDPSAAPATPHLTTTLRGTAVPLDTAAVARAHSGTIASLELKATSGETAGTVVPGKLLENGARWRATGPLEPATAYELRGTLKGADGSTVPVTKSFTTVTLSDAQQVFPSIAPLEGETVGIGMPVIVTFDAGVVDRRAFERKMRVTSRPAQSGSWHWLNDREVHWRPEQYWQSGTTVTVDLALNSVPAGGGNFGQESRRRTFRIGDAHVYKVSATTHQMQVYSNGALIRTIPITTGKEGFVTRSGTKVIIEKFRKRTMDSETTGIGRDDPNYYRVEDVEYAMRLTYSGEFIHAAPWSVGSQGHANVSHGCTGMSTEAAGWLYAMSLRGDVVEYVGTDRPMTLENGFGDWNLSFADWKAGSAL